MAKRKKEKLAEEDKRRLDKQGIRKLTGIFRFMLRYKGVFLLGVLALAVSSLILLAFPRLAGGLLDVASGQGTYFDSISQVAIGVLLILCVRGMFSCGRGYTFSIVSDMGLAD